MIGSQFSIPIIKKITMLLTETMQHNKIAFYCIFNNYLNNKYFVQITEV